MAESPKGTAKLILSAVSPVFFGQFTVLLTKNKTKKKDLTTKVFNSLMLN